MQVAPSSYSALSTKVYIQYKNIKPDGNVNTGQAVGVMVIIHFPKKPFEF